MVKNSTASVQIYEKDGEETKFKDSDNSLLKIKSHWNDGGMVRVCVEGIEITVSASDLEEAITACRWSRY